MEIRQLDPAVYAGRKFTASYRTKGYYDICAAEDGFRLRYVPLGAPMEKSFDDEFFGEWLLGYVEGAPESWNKRYRISNICIFDETARGKGLGTSLMRTIEKAAEDAGARMIVLETQTCNENAIAFYKRNGFSIIGFDLYSYSNDDPERHEVRIEMGKKLKLESKDE